MKLHFTGTPGSFVVVDPGEYKIRIENAIESKARGSGEDVIEIKLRIKSEGSFLDAIVPHSWSLQNQAIWRLENDLWALGIFNQDSLGTAFDADSAEIVKALEGLEAYCSFFTEQFQGQDRSKVVVSSFSTEPKKAQGAQTAEPKTPAIATTLTAAKPTVSGVITSPMKGKKAPF